MKPQPQQARQDVAMDAYSVRLTAWHARQVRRIGGGELGQGMREVIEAYVKAEKEKRPG